MPRCASCQHTWKAKDVVALGFSKKGKDCPHCGRRQYLSAETQRWFTLGWLSLIAVPFLLMTIRLSDKDEPLW